MTIAYLVTAYDQPEHLGRLVHQIKSPQSKVYIHVDKNVSITPFLQAVGADDGVAFLSNRIAVNWMGFSQVESILRLLRAAAAEKFDYCVLLSGSDYPIKNNEYIENFFQNSATEHINFWRLDDRPSWKHKVEYFYPIDMVSIYGYSKNCEPLFWKRYFWGRFFKYQRLMPKRAYFSDKRPFGGSDWWSLSYDCVRFILRYVDEHPEYVRFYRYTHCPSEMFFHSIILNSIWRTRVQNYDEYVSWSRSTSMEEKRQEKSMLVEDTFNLRYIDWSGQATGNREAPATLDERDLEELKNSADLFARKFHPVRSSGLLDRIDEELLGPNAALKAQ